MLQKILIAATMLICLLGFQNCSLYRSEGRKYFDDNAAAYKKTSSASTRIEKLLLGSERVSSTCSPFLNESQASIISNSSAIVELFFNESLQELNCLVVNSNNNSPSEETLCTVSLRAKDLMSQSMAGKMQLIADPHQNEFSSLPADSFAHAETLTNGEIEFTFFGTRTSSPEAVMCKVYFTNSEDFLNHKTLVASRTSYLVHTILHSLP